MGLFNFFKRREKDVAAFNASDTAKTWFEEQRIDLNSARFRTYHEKGLARNAGAERGSIPRKALQTEGCNGRAQRLPYQDRVVVQHTSCGRSYDSILTKC